MLRPRRLTSWVKFDPLLQIPLLHTKRMKTISAGKLTDGSRFSSQQHAIDATWHVSVFRTDMFGNAFDPEIAIADPGIQYQNSLSITVLNLLCIRRLSGRPGALRQNHMHS